MKKLFAFLIVIISLMTFLSCLRKNDPDDADIDISQICLDNLIDSSYTIISKKIVKDNNLTKGQLLIFCNNVTDEDYKTISNKAFEKLNVSIKDLYEVEIAYINDNSNITEFNGEYLHGIQKICRYNKRNNGTLYSYLQFNNHNKLKNIKYDIDDNVVERNDHKIFNITIDTNISLTDGDILDFSKQIMQSIKDLNNNIGLNSCILHLKYKDSFYEFIDSVDDSIAKIEKF